MQAKLTLRMDEALIAEAKQIAKENGKSVSQMVADYFRLFKTKPTAKETPTQQPLSPIASNVLALLGKPNNPTIFEEEKSLAEDLRIENFQHKYPHSPFNTTAVSKLSQKELLNG
ncbi:MULTISPECIES: DUF6364 family protein [unclassified Moraxella]|uniref:DUF6364 family protein n=1 Tax=unclassified Moraxella TaxID=2685852 RepID=UPI003AF9AEA0